MEGDGSAGYGETSSAQPFTHSTAPPRLKYKWRMLWGGLTTEAQAAIQMDEVATFSVTHMRVANEMSSILKTLGGVSERSSITDATACVGGNTASFARFFRSVHAIELDPHRCEMLRAKSPFISRGQILPGRPFHQC